MQLWSEDVCISERAIGLGPEAPLILLVPLIMPIKQMPIYCCLRWIPDVGDFMTDMRRERGRAGSGRGGCEASEEYFHRLASPDRSEARIAQGANEVTFFRKTLRGVSAKSCTILSAENV